MKTFYKIFRYVAAGLFSIGLVLFVLVLAAQFAARRAPTFYREVMRAESEHRIEVGDRLERQVLQLHNDSRKTGRWEASFSAQQINGWLATQLQEKFPDVIPPQFQNPRLAIEQGLVRVACWYKDPPKNTILSLDLDLHLTEEPNVIAVHIHRARAGVIPVPLVQVLNTVSDFARRADIELSWANMNADPVALVTIPSHQQPWKKLLHLEALELREGEIYLAGHTQEEQTPDQPTPADDQPRLGQHEAEEVPPSRR